MKKLKLDYVSKYKNQNISIKKLRPNYSYDYLIKNRNQDLNNLLKSPKRLKKFLVKRNCPSCKSNKTILECFKDGLKIVKCKNCDLIYVSPTFNYDHYINLYKKNEYQKIVKNLGENSHAYRRERFGKERVSILKNFIKKKKINLLDIGCSTGFFVEAAMKNGWNATGIELNPSAVEFGRKKKLNIFNTDYLKTNFKKKFDVICAFDVLEHLYDPKKIVKKIHKDLNKGGLIFVYVPNWQSATRLLLGEQNSHFIWPTHHLTYFTPTTLNDFLIRSNFELVYWETQGLDLFDISWFLDQKGKRQKFLNSNLDKLQFMINSGGYGKNLRMIARKK